MKLCCDEATRHPARNRHQAKLSLQSLKESVEKELEMLKNEVKGLKDEVNRQKDEIRDKKVEINHLKEQIKDLQNERVNNDSPWNFQDTNNPNSLDAHQVRDL